MTFEVSLKENGCLVRTNISTSILINVACEQDTFERIVLLTCISSMCTALKTLFNAQQHPNAAVSELPGVENKNKRPHYNLKA